MRITTRRRFRVAMREIPACTVFVVGIGLIFAGARLVLGWWLP